MTARCEPALARSGSGRRRPVTIARTPSHLSSKPHSRRVVRASRPAVASIGGSSAGSGPSAGTANPRRLGLVGRAGATATSVTAGGGGGRSPVRSSVRAFGGAGCGASHDHPVPASDRRWLVRAFRGGGRRGIARSPFSGGGGVVTCSSAVGVTPVGDGWCVHLEARLAATARHQHGLLTSRQVRAAGDRPTGPRHWRRRGGGAGCTGACWRRPRPASRRSSAPSPPAWPWRRRRGVARHRGRAVGPAGTGRRAGARHDGGRPRRAAGGGAPWPTGARCRRWTSTSVEGSRPRRCAARSSTAPPDCRAIGWRRSWTRRCGGSSSWCTISTPAWRPCGPGAAARCPASARWSSGACATGTTATARRGCTTSSRRPACRSRWRSTRWWSAGAAGGSTSPTPTSGSPSSSTASPTTRSDAEMSVRLFHKHARFVVGLPERDGCHRWLALHRRPIAWGDIFSPALALVGFASVSASEALQFGEGRLDWTTGAFWTTIRLRLPPCSPKKAALLAAGLFKAARYASRKTS